ncbi:MAG: L-serine ammonia-lyase, iron-sulfur-dependent, subunit alpha, partial [Oribacterium sp.]|nr:L-serine ammonia-lyase, iron-sulfur-dependent, subunit alpha [Oribacterium sp.]
MLKYQSIEELVKAAEAANATISALVLADQAKEMECTEQEIYERMERSFDVMVASVQTGNDEKLRSMSGLTGGEGYRMFRYASEGGGLSGGFLTRAMARALAVSNCNASMGRIVASPTAGSCGILP